VARAGPRLVRRPAIVWIERGRRGICLLRIRLRRRVGHRRAGIAVIAGCVGIRVTVGIRVGRRVVSRWRVIRGRRIVGCRRIGERPTEIEGGNAKPERYASLSPTRTTPSPTAPPATPTPAPTAAVPSTAMPAATVPTTAVPSTAARLGLRRTNWKGHCTGDQDDRQSPAKTGPERDALHGISST